jgi:hypothetical protein
MIQPFQYLTLLLTRTDTPGFVHFVHLATGVSTGVVLHCSQVGFASFAYIFFQYEAKCNFPSFPTKTNKFILINVWFEANCETLTFSPVSNENEYERRTLLSGPPQDTVLVSAAHCNYLCKNAEGQVVETCCCLNKKSKFSCRESPFCGSEPTLQLAKPEDLQIVCNLASQEVEPTNLNNNDRVFLNILEIRNHPGYKPLNATDSSSGPIGGNDISVYIVDDAKLKLNKDTVWPACLPKAEEAYIPGNKGILAGWIDPLPTYLYFPEISLGEYSNGNLWQREALLERVACADPDWMKSNTFYPSGTVCYTDLAWAGAVQFGVSGSGIVRPFSSGGEIRYSWAGVLSLSKGSDRVAYPDIDSGFTEYSSNPDVFTDARCHLEWIAAQYDLSPPAGYSLPESCALTKGRETDVNSPTCLSRTIDLFSENYGVWPCKFTDKNPACKLFAFNPNVRPTVNQNFFFCYNIKGDEAICANNCPGMDPNAVVVGGAAALFAVAAATSTAPQLLGPALGAGSLLAGAGMLRMGMANSCPRGQCRVRSSGKCCSLVQTNGRQVCPTFC